LGLGAFLKQRDPLADILWMKTAMLLYVSIFLGTTAPPLWAQEQTADESGVRSRILALEHAWNQAEAFKDLKALDALFDNGLIYVDFDGTLMTKAEFLSRVKGAHLQQVVTQSMSVQVFGDMAVATGVYVSKEFKDGRPITRSGRFIDTWIFKNQTWVCVAAQATPLLR
jgi:ketosteroid isomerase-like protein